MKFRPVLPRRFLEFAAGNTAAYGYKRVRERLCQLCRRCLHNKPAATRPRHALYPAELRAQEGPAKGPSDEGSGPVVEDFWVSSRRCSQRAPWPAVWRRRCHEGRPCV